MDKTFFNVLIGPSLIFAIVYFILAILCIIRLNVLNRSPKAMKIGKIFYLNIFLTCTFRSISSAFLTYVSIAFQRDSQPFEITVFNKIFLNILYIPDILMWNCLAFLFWQLIILFYKGHLQKSYEEFPNDLSGNNSQLSFHFGSLHVMLFFIFLATLIQIIFFILVSTEDISVSVFFIENAVASLITPLVLLLTEIYLHIQYSGLPYRTLFDSENKGRINKRIIYWGFARTLHGVLDIVILISSKPRNFNDYLEEDSSYASFIVDVFILVGEKLLTEIVPFLLVFDMDFMTIFFTVQDISKNNNNINESLINDKSNHNLPETKTSINKNSLNRSSYDEPPMPIPKIDINLMVLDENYANKKRANGLGVIKAYFYSKDKLFKLCVREVITTKLSKYIMEETIKDLGILANLQSNYPDLVVKVKGYDYKSNENRIIFMYEYFPFGSLYDKKKELYPKLEDKIKFIINLSRILETLHGFEPPIIHGHLSSSNVLIDKNLKPRIGDIFLSSFKKYIGISAGYCNKSAYSAPEYFLERGNFIQNAKKSADVYSFGIIMWELLTEKEPFQNIHLKNLKNFVLFEKSRPKIPNSIPEELANIIRVCWQHDEDKRPPFSIIVKSLENLGYLSDSQIFE